MDERRRGQAGLDRLFVFIVVIVAALVLVPTAFGLAGIDIRDGSLLGSDAGADDDTAPFVVLGAYGGAVDDNRSSLGTVEVLVGGAGGSAVDLTGMTVSWAGGGTYELTPPGVGAGEASFAIESVSGSTVLSNASDRAILRFDLGTEDIDAERFGERLEPGDSVDLTLATDGGKTVRVTAVVPDPLPGGTAVRFDVRPR